jgi:hypothetical protein
MACGSTQPPPPAVSIPIAPSNVVATASNQYTARVSWQDNSNNETGFNVDNGCPVGFAGCKQGATLATTAGANVTSVEFTTTPGAYQCFRVQAFNSTGGSAWSSYGCTTTPPLLLPANQPWTDTGVDLNAGDWLQIDASGTIKIAGSDPGKGPGGDPTGCNSSTGGFVAPGLACYSLIGRFGNGAPFEIGPSFHAPVSGGRLYLGVNDGYFADNSGSWTVNIHKG